MALSSLKQFLFSNRTLVGASLLAMDVNDDEGCLNARGALRFIASKLAPTGVVVKLKVC
jgi:hypothetical protein